MRSSIAIILSAAAACVVSAMPSYAGGNQMCRPTGTSPILYVCDSGGFENSVAYSSTNYSISAPNGGDKGSCGYSYSAPSAAAGPSAAAAGPSGG